MADAPSLTTLAMMLAVGAQSAIAPPPSLLVLPLRDREGATPVARRLHTAWWDEVHSRDPLIYTDEEFKATVRLPRRAFAYVAREIAKDPVFQVGANVGSRAIPVKKQLMCYLLRVGDHKKSSEVAKCCRVSPRCVPPPPFYAHTPLAYPMHTLTPALTAPRSPPSPRLPPPLLPCCPACASAAQSPCACAAWPKLLCDSLGQSTSKWPPMGRKRRLR